MPGNTATSAANTKVPAHVGWTRCSPLREEEKLSLLLFRPDQLQATLPLASVHHHIHCVKCSEVGAVSQDMGKNASPARVSNLTCSLIGQRGMCVEPCIRVPNDKGWTGVKRSSAAIITW